jgi:hypothetical protein
LGRLAQDRQLRFPRLGTGQIIDKEFHFVQTFAIRPQTAEGILGAPHINASIQ